MKDVLILYEHKNRELENSVLLMLELNRRGYSVSIKNINSPSRFFINPKVLVAPHIYNDDQVYMFGKNIWNSNNALVSLQYEQVLARGEYANPNDLHFPKGEAKYAHHIAWGPAQTKRYLQCGIKRENIHETGFISMDLFRKEFRSYFKSRDEIAHELNIDTNKEWILFVSSFSYVDRSEEEMIGLRELNVWADLKAKIANTSFAVVLDWFTRAASQNPDKVFIYRPHPAEKNNQRLKEIELKYSNFRCIDNYSMRQWALIIDRAYNWYSTSAADLYFAHKPSILLRPIPIPEEIDMELFDNFKRITSYEDFIETVKNSDQETMLDASLIESYYGDGKGRMAYKKVADVCEKLIKGTLETYNYNYTRSKDHKLKFWEYVKVPLYYISYIFGFKEWYFLPSHMKKTMKLYRKDIYGVRDEVKRLKKRFAPIIDSIEG